MYLRGAARQAVALGTRGLAGWPGALEARLSRHLLKQIAWRLTTAGLASVVVSPTSGSRGHAPQQAEPKAQGAATLPFLGIPNISNSTLQNCFHFVSLPGMGGNSSGRLSCVHSQGRQTWLDGTGKRLAGRGRHTFGWTGQANVRLDGADSSAGTLSSPAITLQRHGADSVGASQS